MASFPTSIKTFTTKVDGVTDVLASHVNDIQDEVNAIETELFTYNYTGWIRSLVTWTYASASTFTVSGDVTAKFPKGTKIKLTQTSAKYFYVVGASYSAPNTTVTITGGSDYTLANAAITSPMYSYAVTPQGFPDWFNWSPTLAGFSANPAGATYQFRIDGKTVFFLIEQPNNGTSNATNFTITMPVTNDTVPAGNTCGLIVDNSVVQTAAGRWFIGAASATMQLQKDMGTTVFTASGGKRARIQGFYSF